MPFQENPMKHLAGNPHQLPGNRQSLRAYPAQYLSYRLEGMGACRLFSIALLSDQ